MKVCSCWWACHLQGGTKGRLTLEHDFPTIFDVAQTFQFVRVPRFSSPFLLIDCFSLWSCFLPCEFLPSFNPSFAILAYVTCNLYPFRRMKELDVLPGGMFLFIRGFSSCGLLSVLKHGKTNSPSLGHTSWLCNWAEKYGISLLPYYYLAISLILVIVLCVCKMTD